MKPFQTLPCINSRLTNGKLKHSATLVVAICISSISMVDASRAELWFEDFTDGNLSDSGIDWLFGRDHSISSDGLLLSTPDTGGAAAGVDWPADRQGWSIRTQARLLQDHGVLGMATTTAPGRGSAEDTFNAIHASGWTQLGSGLATDDQWSERVETDLRPFQEDVIIQLDTLDGVMRMWAWRDGEQPTEDVAPLIEEDFDLPNASPYIWTVSFEGPSSALFSWIAISTEHMPVNDLVYVPVPLGDVNGDGVVNGLDVDPFVDVLLNGPYQAEADMNDDGDVNGLDVDPFVAAVVGGGVAAVPEPATWGLALLAAVALACWQRRERC